MLKYSKGHKISLNLTLINNDGSPEANAEVKYELYDENSIIILSNNNLTYNEQLGSYIDVIDPTTQWSNQEEGIYYIKWYIDNTTEDYPNTAVEELYIELYDEKLDRILGLSHENTYIDEPEYDKYHNLKSARMRLYSDSLSVGSNNNVIAIYRITAVSDGLGKFLYWEQKMEE